MVINTSSKKGGESLFEDKDSWMFWCHSSQSNRRIHITLTLLPVVSCMMLQCLNLRVNMLIWFKSDYIHPDNDVWCLNLPSCMGLVFTYGLPRMVSPLCRHVTLLLDTMVISHCAVGYSVEQYTHNLAFFSSRVVVIVVHFLWWWIQYLSLYFVQDKILLWSLTD